MDTLINIENTAIVAIIDIAVILLVLFAVSKALIFLGKNLFEDWFD